jgi:sugar/nucleoside kinase (ribokinase family)
MNNTNSKSQEQSTGSAGDSRHGFLAGGNFITDFVKVLDQWPEQDTLASIRSESMCNGGGPYNILKDLAQLAPNIPRAACGLIGNDLNGDWIVNDCLSANIDTTQLHRTNAAPTSYTDAMTVAPTGRRTFFHQRGANALLTPEHFDFDRANSRVFVLGYLMLLDAMDVVDANGMTGGENVLRSAREAGLIAAVDCVSEAQPTFRRVVLAALSEADILFINEFEIGQVLGVSVSDQKDSMISAARELAKQCKRTSTQVVLHSPNGAVVATSEGEVIAQPSVRFPAEKIAGASGAGDAFAAGFLLGVHEKQSVEACLENAVCTAAMSLTDPTPSGGMSSLSECLELGATFGFQTF